MFLSTTWERVKYINFEYQSWLLFQIFCHSKRIFLHVSIVLNKMEDPFRMTTEVLDSESITVMTKALSVTYLFQLTESELACAGF